MRQLNALVTGTLLFAAFTVAGPAFGDEAGPESGSKSASDKAKGGAARLLSFYRDHISAVDGDRCPSYPSCSSYSVDAFRKHGFVMGWLMTVDRLIHEGREEAAVSPRVRSSGTWKIYDPVENNDFWWYHPDQRGHEKD